jgi:two-component system, chemotaxis family, response regulator Rcp1
MDRGEPIHILMAGKEEADRAMASQMLAVTKLHNKLDFFADGQALLDYLHRAENAPERRLPDLILLDLHAPKKDGCAVVAEMQADPLLKDITVVLLTSGTVDEPLLRNAGLNKTLAIPRPLTFGKLVHTLARLRRYWLQIETTMRD